MKLSPLSLMYLGILLAITGLIILHAPLTVVAGTLFPSIDDLSKSWKELLMIPAGVCAAILITKHRAWQSFIRDKLMWALGTYVLLHIVMATLLPQGIWATLAGFAVDLRYIAFFTLVYIGIRLYPEARPVFVKVGIIGAAIVVGFATLQLFLPKDILTYIGYNKDTIMPYMTVDGNHDYIRANSTLRGPNSLGAYAAMVLLIALGFVTLQRGRLSHRSSRWLIAVFISCSVIALWISYSRSALLAAVLGMAVIVVVVCGKKVKPAWWIVGSCLMIATAVGGFMAVKDTSFVSNIILHEDPAEGNSVGSNAGHVESLQYGIKAMIAQPFGAGVGSTGTASYHGPSPVIIENQYLFIAHEVGWLGIILFLVIFIEVMRRVWLRRQDWLALGVFASGISLAVIGVLLPVWVDDTISIIWWGFAAVAIASKGAYARSKAK